MTAGVRNYGAAILMAAALTCALPFFVHAQTNIAAGADASCNPVYPQCPPNQMPGSGGCQSGANRFMQPCSGGNTTGICDAPNHCKATGFNAMSGQQGGATGMSQLTQALQGLMSSLMQGMGGGGGGGGGGSPSGAVPPPITGVPGSLGCAQYYVTSDPNNTDPCAQYVGSVATNTPQSANNPSPTAPYTYDYTVPPLPIPNPTSPVPVTNPNPSTPTDTTGTNTPSTNAQQNLTSGASASNNATAQDVGHGVGFDSNSDLHASISDQQSIFQAQMQGGTRGNIELGPNGEMIFVSGADINSNTGFSGFYGGAGTTFGGGGGGIVANLCKNRPWSGGLLSGIIPASFFDSLCTWRGYQVGQPPVSSSTPALSGGGVVHDASNSFVGTPPQIPQSTTSATGPLNPPQVRIWAMPVQVPIGGRTSVFWNSSGAASCLVTSPDGSFHETALSGGAATVPISGLTIFTIVCVAPDGSDATASVSVNLKS